MLRADRESAKCIFYQAPGSDRREPTPAVLTHPEADMDSTNFAASALSDGLMTMHQQAANTAIESKSRP